MRKRCMLTVAKNNAKYLKFYGGKVESTRNGNFGDYPGDIKL